MLSGEGVVIQLPGEVLLRWMVPRATYCCSLVMVCRVLLIPATIWLRSAVLMLPVRSATRATFMGFGIWAPQDPLHASEASEPVFPVSTPITGANEKGTALSSVTVMVLQMWPLPGRARDRADILVALGPGTVPGLQTLGIWPAVHGLGGPGGSDDAPELTAGSAAGSLALANATAAFWAATGSFGSEAAPASAAASRALLRCWRS